jgi:cytochrome c peroxidase
MSLPLVTPRFFAPQRWYRWLLASLIVAGAIGAISVYSRSSTDIQNTVDIAAEGVGSSEPIQPIVALPGLDPSKIDLGRNLFSDRLLSHTREVSCATCHDLKAGGTDRNARSIGINGSIGEINAPTVLNSGFSFSQFWDGRAPTLETQIDGPIQSKIEMGSTWPEIIGRLRGIPSYLRAFREAYHDDINSEHVKDSIAEYERSLSTPESRFDRYLRHDTSALTDRELQGYQLFKSFGCTSCHQGMGVGGNMYQKLGIMAPYFTDRGHITKADRGRFNATGDPKDLYMFKVPSLRNVELTAPYFHDGSAATLPDAIRLMAKYQLGRPLRDEEIQLITEFLKTLTGKLDGKPL